MNLLPFGTLPPHKPRQFVPVDLDLGDWSKIAPLFDELEKRAAGCKTVADFERWLLDRGELSAALDEEGAKRQIAMTCHTDNADAEKAYLHFVEKIEPELKPRQFKLSQIYVAHPMRQKLPKDRYAVLDRDTQLHVELFRPENVPLETEEAKLGQQYQKLYGSLTVQFRGQEKTLAKMAPYLEEPTAPCARKRGTWWLNADCRKAKNSRRFLINLCGCGNKSRAMPALRTTAITPFAKWAGSITPPPIANGSMKPSRRRSCRIVRELQAERKRQMELESLRPWDLGG